MTRPTLRALINLVETAARPAPLTPAFRQWFGHSRVIDGHGNPLPVYHGTNQTFKTFSKRRGGMATGPQAGAIHGFFFTHDRDEAQEYATHAGGKVVANITAHERECERLRVQAERLERAAMRSGRDADWRAHERAHEAWEQYEIGRTREDTEVNTQVIAAYLSLQNPLEADFQGGNQSEWGTIEDVVGKAVADRHDGAILRNIYDGPLGGRVSDHYVVFSAKQIRRIG